MYIIRSADEMARYLASGIDADLHALLTAKVAELTGYDGCELGDLSSFLIVQPGDTLDDVEDCVGRSMSDAEYTKRLGGWIEMVIILSDDGYGWVIYRLSADTF